MRAAAVDEIAEDLHLAVMDGGVLKDVQERLTPGKRTRVSLTPELPGWDEEVVQRCLLQAVECTFDVAIGTPKTALEFRHRTNLSPELVGAAAGNRKAPGDTADPRPCVAEDVRGEDG